MTDEDRHLIVRGVPPRLKGKIAKRVQKRSSNLNDVVVEVLCRYFSIAYEPNGRRSPSEIGAYPNLVLDVPGELKRRIDHERADTGESMRNLVVKILAEEFGEPFVATGRWVGTRKKRDRRSPSAA